MSTTPTSTAPAPTGPAAACMSARLAPGVLRATVAAHLAADPSTAYTVTQVAKALNASGGAVGNALMALAAAGQARQTSGNPRTFTANANTASAASGAIVPAAVQVAPATQRPARHRCSVPAPASPSVATLVDPAAPVARPNGTLYRPRALAGLSDVAALRAAREAEAPVLLYGPPGTGKTSLIEAAFPDVVTVTADPELAVSDLVGQWTQNPDGTYRFVYGPLVTAMTEGRVLFIDDATLAPSAVLSCLFPAMDGRKTITVKAHAGETVQAAPGFFVVAAHNPNVTGAAVLTEALSSRFSIHIHLATDFQIAEELGVNRKAVRVAKNLATRAEKGEVTWSVQLRELLAFAKVEQLLGTEAAFANLIGIAPESERDAVAEIVASVTGTRTEPLSVGTRLTPASKPAQP
jgi:nitric oxide reductase NorQ protein